MFNLTHQGTNYRCNQSIFNYNPSKATVTTNRKGITTVTCKDEHQTRKTVSNQCSTVTYNTPECNKLPERYHCSNQKYYTNLYYIVEPYSSSSSQYNNNAAKDYCDAVLNDLIKDLQACTTSTTCFKEYEVIKDKSKYWSRIVMALEDLKDEINHRLEYKNNCTCISDLAHDSRIKLCQQLFQALKSLHLVLLRHELKKIDGTIILIQKPYDISDYPSLNTYTIQELFMLFVLCEKAKSDYMVNIRADCTKLLKKHLMHIRIILPLHTEPSKQLLTETTIGIFYLMCTKFCKELMGPILAEKVRPIFRNVNTYFSNGISCIKYHPETNLPQDIRINYNKLNTYISKTENIEFSGDSLKDYIEHNVLKPSYKACLQSWYDNDYQTVVTLCEQLNKMDLPQSKIDVAQEFCSTSSGQGGLMPGLQNLVNKDPKGFDTAWNKTKPLNQKLGNNTKPKYVLSEDFSNLSLLNISALLQSYLWPDYKKKYKVHSASVPSHVRSYILSRKRQRSVDAKDPPEQPRYKQTKVYRYSG